MSKMNVLIAGATGYLGNELIKNLVNHKKIKIKYLCGNSSVGKKITDFDKSIKSKLPKITKITKSKINECDIIFSALPNGEAQIISKKLNKHNVLIDLSGDFRLRNSNNYFKWYKQKHVAIQNIKKSIYLLPELSKFKLNNYQIISCPGCYPTSILLPLVPLVKNNLIKKNNIIIDSKSGYSGAGKNLKKKFKHKNLFSSIHAYGTYKHRHVSELDQELNKVSKSPIKYIFIPHLIPTFRGMLSSIYLDLKTGVSAKRILNELKKFYKNNFFIKINPINKNIGTENVLNTNFCEISVCELKEKRKILILSAIDNLVKGAGGQAIQNMNILYGFKENMGLK